MQEYVINYLLSLVFVFFYLLGKNTTICFDTGALHLQEFTIPCASKRLLGLK